MTALPTSGSQVVSEVSAAASQDETSPVPSSRPQSLMLKLLKGIKVSISMILVLFSVVVVSTAICTKQTVATAENGVHPALAFCIFWFSLAWLAILEGGLNAMVGLQPIPKDVYKNTHRKAYLCTKIAHKDDNIERFIVGRQYLDLTIVFITSFMVSTVAGAQVLGLPKLVNDIFLGQDLGVILCTIVFGQLVSVVNCSHNLLDYINNWCMVASTNLALFVESTGILHAVYFVQIIFTKIATRNTSKDVEISKKEKQLDTSKPSKHSDTEQDSDSSHSRTSAPDTMPPSIVKGRPLWQRIFFWARVIFSLGMSVFTVTVFTIALVGGNTTVRAGIPVYASIISLVILLFLGGFMEALQIALFAVKHLPANEIEANERAKRNCEFMFKKNNYSDEDDGKLRAFLVGRQIAQTVIMFMIARIISVDMKVEGETLFGVSPQVQRFLFDSGLLNALVSAIFASLSWRVTANFFPLVYLGSPVSIWIMRLCLLVEGSGICDSAWIFAKIPDLFVHYRSDKYYISKAEESCSSSPSQHDEQDLEAAERTEQVITKGYRTESIDIVSTGAGSSDQTQQRE